MPAADRRGAGPGRRKPGTRHPDPQVAHRYPALTGRRRGRGEYPRRHRADRSRGVRTVGDQRSLWDSWLPEEMLRLPKEMVPVDALMDDPTFFVLFGAYFDLGFGHAPDRIWGNRRRLYPSRNSRVVVTLNGVAQAIHNGPAWIDSVLYSSSISLSACRVPNPVVASELQR